MPSPALSIVQTEPAPNRLAGLLAERGKIAAEAADINRRRANLSNFENEEAAIHAEIGHAGHTLAREMAEWAKNPKGEAPKVDAAKREALAHKLIAAQSRAVAATQAIATLDARQIELRDEDARLSREIEAEIYDRIEVEFLEKSTELSRLIAATRQAAGPIFALTVVLAEQGRAFSDAGQIDLARPFFARNERLALPDLIEASPTNGEVAEAARYWRERAAALRSGDAT